MGGDGHVVFHHRPVSAPQQRVAPHRRRRVEEQPGDVRQVRSGLEDGVGKSSLGLVHPDHVGPGRVLHSFQGERTAGLFHLDVVEEEEVDQPGRLMRAHLERRPGRNHPGGRELLDRHLVELVVGGLIEQLIGNEHLRKVEEPTAEDLDLVVEHCLPVLGDVLEGAPYRPVVGVHTPLIPPGGLQCVAV